MNNWLQSHLKVAENILDAVDKTVSKTIVQGTSGSFTDGNPVSAIYAGGSTSDYSNSTASETISAPVQHLPHGSGINFSGKQQVQTVENAPATAPPAVPPQESRDGTARNVNNTSMPASQTHSRNPPPAQIPPPRPTNVTSNPFQDSKPVTSTPPSLDPAPKYTTAPKTTVTPSKAPEPTSATSTPTMNRTPSLPQPGSSPQLFGDPSPSPSSDSLAAGGSLREARLTKLADQLRKRLEESRSENQQLEELLQAAELQAAEHKARASSAQAELDALTKDRSTAEDVFQATVTAKDVQCQRLKIALDDAQQQVSQLQAAVAALEESKRQVMESKGELEGSILEALRSDVRVAEHQLDSERKAHQATKAAAAARQLELEGHLENNASALAVMQHSLEETGRKSRALEEQVALLQAENARFAQRLAAAEAAATAASSTSRSEAPPSPGSEGGGSSLEYEALKRELSRQRGELQRAERARRAAEGEVTRLQEQLVAAQDSLAMSSPNQGGRGVEAQLKEMGEMLFIKQTQLEKLAADKAAQHLMLERELGAAREEVGRLRGALQRHQDASRSGSHDVIPMDSLGEPYQRLVRHNRFGGAVRTAAGFLDSTASSASHVLRQYPLVRLGIFFYVVVLHLYLWFLTMRMQHMALRMDVSHPAPAVL